MCSVILLPPAPAPVENNIMILHLYRIYRIKRDLSIFPALKKLIMFDMKTVSYTACNFVDIKGLLWTTT